MDAQESGVYLVETKSYRHCFASGLRSPQLKQGQRVPCYQIIQDGLAPVYVSGLSDSANDRIQPCAVQHVSVDRRFADRLGLQSRNEVIVHSIHAPSVCTTATLEPLTPEEWEVLELHASFVESQLLSQIRVLYPGVVFPFWINLSTVVYLKTVSFEPAGECVLLDRNTEVQVVPKVASSPDIPWSTSAQSNDRPSNHPTPKPAQQPATSAPVHVAASKSTLKSEKATEDVNRSNPRGDDSSWLGSLHEWSTSKLTLLHESLSSANWPAVSMEGGMVWGDTGAPVNSGGSGSSSSTAGNNNNRGAPVSSVAESTSSGQLSEPARSDRHACAVANSAIFRVQHQPMGDVGIPRCCLQQPNAVLVGCKTWYKKFKCSPVPDQHECTDGSDDVYLATLHTFQHDMPSSTWWLKNAALHRPAPTRGGAADTGNSGGAGQLVTVHVLCEPSLPGSSFLPGHVLVDEVLRRVSAIPARHPVALCDVGAHRQNCALKGIILRPVVEAAQVSSFSESAVKEAFVAFVEEMTCEEHSWMVPQHSVCTLNVDSLALDVRVECLGAQAATVGQRSVSTAPIFAIDAACLGRLHIAVDFQTAAATPREGNPSPMPALSSVDQSRQLQQFSELGGVQSLALRGLRALLPALTVAHATCGTDIASSSSSSSGSKDGGVDMCCPAGVLVCGAVAASQSGQSAPQGASAKNPGSDAVASQASARVVFGRTALAEALAHYARESPALAHVEVIECLHWKGKRGDAIENKLHNVLLQCVQCQPSILLLDDVDMIAPSAASLPDDRQDLMYASDRYAQALCDLVDELRSGGHRVAIIATSATADSLHPTLCRRIFHEPLVIQPPNKEDRLEILRRLLQKADLSTKEDFDLSDIAAQADGYVVGDLQHLVAQATHHLACRTIQSLEAVAALSSNDGSAESSGGASCQLIAEDFEHVMADYTPVLYQSVQGSGKLADSTTFADIGGLEDAKAALKQALMWPAKYPQVFSQCPVKLTSGLLLYGMPGTGKTFLAKAVAQECNVRFIHVKGPELLNKYIGASEQAVRQVMARALAAQPCVVFFDEFDALAPRRGHDSTGVTDRVVNQLLTQLDGVEGREGVFVLAATSRPDLIDPALLRPGRLDKSILCPLPSREQRVSILQCLATEVKLSADIHLEQLASSTVDFTGADLRALLFNAQLAAVHSVKPQVTGQAGLVLTPDHISSALSSTKPSLPDAERKRLDKLYAKFSKKRDGTPGGHEWLENQRATLA
ncbi:peroxisomal ATPase PEX1-like [Sycon ciliatum]|uniref:peroxisomal ATPase PEX1-like n=1 Tax=Sycon ciliatum TaxID=27933 RepID=UPI0031F717F8|eukprot:scpid54429/ scgid19774/ Peroxisome biogenesis factor 1; Peroxin-1; Peroxisome biogenesis disorder protein 1